jgi:hypothetical protein
MHATSSIFAEKAGKANPGMGNEIPAEKVHSPSGLGAGGGNSVIMTSAKKKG